MTRLILKTLGYRVLSATVIYVVTGSVMATLTIEIVKAPLYFLYDLAWHSARSE